MKTTKCKPSPLHQTVSRCSPTTYSYYIWIMLVKIPCDLNLFLWIFWVLVRLELPLGLRISRESCIGSVSLFLVMILMIWVFLGMDSSGCGSTNWSKLCWIDSEFGVWNCGYQGLNVCVRVCTYAASAIESIKTQLNLSSYSGDPCVYIPYDWINCTQVISPPRIVSM